MNTCRSVDSKWLRMHNNCAVLGPFLLRDDGRVMGARAAADVDAYDDFVANKFGVVAVDFSVVEIVVFAAVFDERGEGGGQFLRLVLGNEVHYVIGDQGGKPARVFACCFKVVGGPDGGCGHDFDLAEVAAGFSKIEVKIGRAHV